MSKRFWEIDVLRGIAIVMMIVFHFLFNLAYFANYSINMNFGFWKYFGRATAIIFIFLVGVSLTLSYSKIKGNWLKNYPNYLKRGLKIFFWGLIITLITFIFLRENFVIFGILHFIGISIILAYPFLKVRKEFVLLIGILFIIIGEILKRFFFSFPWLMWLGLQPYNLVTADYFPLFPWFGVVLIGMFFGFWLYPNYKSKINLPDLSRFKIIQIFSFLGKHSLIIYLIHQPILILILGLMGFINISLFI